MGAMEAGALPRAGSGTPAQTPRLLKLAPDARLVGLVREGRVGAFEALYDRHHKGILSFCRHMLSDADEAEDAVQHTFMAAYRELADSDEPIHVRAWLYTVARNRCYSIIRGRREQPSDSIDTAATEGLATEVQRRQDLRDLVADLRRLPDEQRAALVLAELDALSHEDIAGVLGVPRDKVKALVYQARESLVAERTARDTSCSEIREQLASGRGAVLRRANLRRHLRECDGCREFRAQVGALSASGSPVLLPVLPAAALKEGLFGGAGLVIGGTAAVGGGAVAATALKTGVAKGVLGAVLASVGTAGTLVFTGSGMQVKSFVHGIERAVPKFVPTSRLIDQPPPRAKPIRVTSTHPAVIRSFSPTRVVKPATASRSVPVAAVPVAEVPVTKHSREHVPARIAAPVPGAAQQPAPRRCDARRSRGPGPGANSADSADGPGNPGSVVKSRDPSGRADAGSIDAAGRDPANRYDPCSDGDPTRHGGPCDPARRDAGGPGAHRVAGGRAAIDSGGSVNADPGDFGGIAVAGNRVGGLPVAGLAVAELLLDRGGGLIALGRR